VRIISATHKDLEKAVKAGQFRADLYYRINVIPIDLPPLRERKEDVHLLANHFLRQFTQRKKISPQAMACLTQFDWPGNIRELRNVIENVVTLTKDTEIKVEDLPPKVQENSISNYPTMDLPITMTLPSLNIEQTKRILAQKALEYTSDNKKQAASVLGLSEAGFHLMIKRFNKK